MAKINRDAFWFAMLYGTCKARDVNLGRIALLVDKYNMPRMMARGTGTAPNSTRTSVVNVLQHTAQTAGQALKQATIYTTEAVTEMDLGMARRAMVGEIITTASGAMKAHETALDTHDGSGSNVALGGNYTNAPWITNRKNLTAWINPGNFSSYGADLRDFRDSFSNDDNIKALKSLAIQNAGVAALTFDVPLEGKNLGVSKLGLSEAEKHMIFLATAHQMVERLWGQRQEDDDRRKSSSYVGWNIGALLVDAAGDNILAWGVNTNKLNSTRHGEVNLIQHYEAKLGTLPLPQDATFYTTLEPCQMCAGMLASVGRKNGLKVVWGQDDIAIKQSALQRNALGVGQAGSAARFGVHGWAEVMAMHHKETAARLKLEAEDVVRRLDGRGFLPTKEFQALKEAKSFLDGLNRFGSIQTTEFLRQAEAHLFFERARTRRHMQSVTRQLNDLRRTIEGLGGEFKPSSVKGTQQVGGLIEDLLVDQGPLLAAHRKLDSFVGEVGKLMKRA